nr:hypothetical protein Iba_chr04bCG15330 [Ipomoea batatas]
MRNGEEQGEGDRRLTIFKNRLLKVKGTTWEATAWEVNGRGEVAGGVSRVGVAGGVCVEGERAVCVGGRGERLLRWMPGCVDDSDAAPGKPGPLGNESDILGGDLELFVGDFGLFVEDFGLSSEGVLPTEDILDTCSSYLDEEVNPNYNNEKLKKDYYELRQWINKNLEKEAKGKKWR